MPCVFNPTTLAISPLPTGSPLGCSTLSGHTISHLGQITASQENPHLCTSSDPEDKSSARFPLTAPKMMENTKAKGP